MRPRVIVPLFARAFSALRTQTAAAEASMGPHLHFSVEKDGTLIDPKEYVK